MTKYDCKAAIEWKDYNSEDAALTLVLTMTIPLFVSETNAMNKTNKQ